MAQGTRAEAVVRGLRADELDVADAVLRRAFGTHLGLADPMTFMGDGDYVRTRWQAAPDLALAAEVDGTLVGTNFVTCWGSVGFFGPLSVEPAWWGRGVARALLEATLPLFEAHGVQHRGLFTFGQSPKHVSLYQAYGFLPRYLTAILAKGVEPGAGGDSAGEWTTASAEGATGEVVDQAAELTGAILDGLDVRREIEAVADQGLGDTVLVPDPAGGLAGFAVCHAGAGTEAGSGRCYVKFAAVRPGDGAAERLDRLVGAYEAYAAGRDVSWVSVGVSTARRGAYRALLQQGYRPERLGVAMHAPDGDAYHHPAAYVLDDWR